MRVLVTGAGGFIGRALVARLLADAAVAAVVAMDRRIAGFAAHAKLEPVEGDLGDAATRRRALAAPVDVVFHLAGVMSGQSETDYDLARHVNLDSTLGLIEDLRTQGKAPRFIYASSIGVYGASLAAPCISDDTSPAPNSTYGAQKLIGEILVADFTRRGWLDACVLRLPGIVVRPPEPNGALSIFLSDIIRELMAGRAYVCPVSPAAMSWWMSLSCCIDNLVHAARIVSFETGRVFMMPALRFSIGALVDEIAALRGAAVHDRVSYAPDPALEAGFGSFPELAVPRARAAGFKDDGSIRDLLLRGVPA